MLRTSGAGLRAWLITIMLALFMTLNFMDKAILGIVAKPLMAELHISPEQFGMIASSFFLLFSLSAIGFGFFANRFSAKLALLICAAIWGLAQFPLAFTASVPLLFFSRILLGFGEGPAYPLALHACYKWFRDDQRNVPSAVIYQGVTAGLLISGPFLTFIFVRWGWHAAFLAMGIGSLVWAVLWLLVGAEGSISSESRPAANTATSAEPAQRLSYWTMLLDPTFLANMLLYWTTYWIFSVMFTWTPSYLSTVMHYDATTTGWMFMLFTAFGTPIVLGGSWLSERLLRSGASSAKARGGLTCIFVLLGGAMTLLAVYGVQQPLLKVLMLALGCNLPQITFVLSSTIVAEIIPDGQRSAMMAINSALATTGGLVAPALMGRFIQSAATPALGYDHGFMVAGALSVAASAIGYLLIRPERSKQRFALRSRAAAPAPVSRSAIAAE